MCHRVAAGGHPSRSPGGGLGDDFVLDVGLGQPGGDESVPEEPEEVITGDECALVEPVAQDLGNGRLSRARWPGHHNEIAHHTIVEGDGPPAASLHAEFRRTTCHEGVVRL